MRHGVRTHRRPFRLNPNDSDGDFRYSGPGDCCISISGYMSVRISIDSTAISYRLSFGCRR